LPFLDKWQISEFFGILDIRGVLVITVIMVITVITVIPRNAGIFEDFFRFPSVGRR
jgi:hypothetical protein